MFQEQATQSFTGSWWEQVGPITLALVPLHQALVEVLYKTLYGAKQRRYYEALAYIIGGVDLEAAGQMAGPPSRSKDPEDDTGSKSAGTESASLTRARTSARDLLADDIPWKVGRAEKWFGVMRFVPSELPDGVRKFWASGPQRRLIESLILRGVGDSQTPELGDTDLNNIAQIARREAGPGVENTLTALDLLVRNGIADPAEAIVALEEIDVKGKPAKDVEEWVSRLKNMVSTPAKEPLGILFNLWRQQFTVKYVPAEQRARAELANTIKSAEYRYHRGLVKFSTTLALIESLLVNYAVNEQLGAAYWASVAVSFSALVLAPQGTKSLLDAIVGLGARLKP